MAPRALSGRRSVTSPLNVFTLTSSPSLQLRACTSTPPLKVLTRTGPDDIGEPDVAREAVHGHGCRETPVTEIGRAEGPQIELRLTRHLDLEIGLDDVVVAPFDDSVVGVDLDAIASLAWISSLMSRKPFGGRTPHGVDDDLIAARPGNRHAP